jgi:hypothetical protein
LKSEFPLTEACHSVIFFDKRVDEVFLKHQYSDQLELENANEFGLMYGEEDLMEYLKEEADFLDGEHWDEYLNDENCDKQDFESESLI